MATDYLPQPMFYQVWKLAHQEELSEEALRRWRWERVRRFERAMRGGLASWTAAEVVGVSRATLYRWRARLKKDGSNASTEHGGASSTPPATYPPPRPTPPGPWLPHPRTVPSTTPPRFRPPVSYVLNQDSLGLPARQE